MPVYLLHGFRWPRLAIRHHIIFNNIDDAAPEYIVTPQTSAALLESFHDLYSEVMDALPKLRFIEPYDPMDVSSNALPQPYAFVADKVEICHLSLDVSSAMTRGIPSEGWDALMDLKERLAPGEKLGWWIVYNGDELRRLVGDSKIEQVGLRLFLAAQKTNRLAGENPKKAEWWKAQTTLEQVMGMLLLTPDIEGISSTFISLAKTIRIEEEGYLDENEILEHCLLF